MKNWITLCFLFLFHPLIGLSHDPSLAHSVNVVLGEWQESAVDLQSPGPKALQLKRAYPHIGLEGIPEGWRFSFPNIGLAATKNPPEIISEHIQAVYDKEHRLVSITQNDPANLYPLHHFTFAYAQTGSQHMCTVTSDQGESIRYHWYLPAVKEGEGGPILQEVSFADGTSIRYTYTLQAKTRHNLLNRRIDPSGSCVEIARYKQGENNFAGLSVKIKAADDWRIGRVMGLTQKSADGLKEKIIATFVYRPGETEVIDGANHSQVYTYDSYGRVTALEAFLEGKTPYRTEKFFWNEDSHLIGHSLCQASGQALSSHTYAYDAQGRLIQEAIWGNLSGVGPETFTLDGHGKPVQKNVECHQIDSLYEGDSDRILRKIENSGKRVNYTYDPVTHQETAKVISEHGVDKMAQYSTYNSRGFLVEQTFTDLESPSSSYKITYAYRDNTAAFTNSLQDSAGRGKARSKHSDLNEKGMAEAMTDEEDRSGKAAAGWSRDEFVKVAETPLAGLPYAIRRFGSDGTLLEETLIEYTPQGAVQTREKRSPSGITLERSGYQYDARGRTTLKLDQNGNAEETLYDANGRMTEQNIRNQGSKKKHRWTYDDFGLCNSETTVEAGLIINSSYTYDTVGNKICDKKLNHAILFTYDALGRCLTKAHLNAPYQAATYTYREDGLPISIRDGNGHTTGVRYNIRRQPTAIHYADGTKESYLYNPEGSLMEKVARNGWKTVYARDYLGRETVTELWTPENTLFQKTENHYSAFHLLSTRDEKGVETQYTYDSNGREVQRRTSSSSGVLLVTSSYDTDGELEEQREWIENEPASLVVSKVSKTAQGTLIELFDSQDNKIRHQELAAKKEMPTVVEWIQEEDVLKRIETMPDGLKTVSIQDPRGLILAQQAFSAHGKTLSHQEFGYDAAGQKIEEISFYIDATGMKTDLTRKTRWYYGACGCLETLERIAEDGSIRTTHYSYDQNGHLVSTQHPNESQLLSTYDTLGRLQRQFSTDGSVDYIYSYDHAGRVTSAQDQNTGLSVARNYDSLGHLIEESYHPNLSIRYAYDARGRRTQLQLPDLSDIIYAYDAIALQAIICRDAKGKEKYRHTYQYDWKGEISAQQPIGNLPEIQRSRTLEEWQTTSPFWQQNVRLSTSGKPYAISSQDAIGVLDQQFEHDDKGQLIGQYSLEPLTYTYNCWGECLLKNESPFIYTPWGELQSALGKQYQYDANGNLTAQKIDEQEQHYIYDALNRLIEVQHGNTRIRYVYDAFDRRLKKSWESRDSNAWVVQDVEYYLYDGNKEIACLDAHYRIKQLRILGDGLGADIGASVAVEIEGKVFAPIHDYRGSVVALIDSESQAVVESYRYSPFGETAIYDAAGRTIESSLVNNPWRFSGKRFDPETNWYYFGRRYYDPSVGRWTTQDPLAVLDGDSTYSYVNNSPLQQIDLYGLFSIGSAWNGIKNGFLGFWNWKEGAIQTLQGHLSFEHQIKGDVQFVLEETLGYLFLSFAGYYNQPMEAGTYGNGQVMDKVRITFLNGIGNIRYDLGVTLKALYKGHGNTPIHYIFFPTQGFGKDLLRCLTIKLGFTSPTAYALAETWKKLIADLGGTENGGMIIHYAHSIGGSNTLAAANLLTPEERKMIRIITLGTASIIPDLGFESVMNYVSIRDGISLLADPFGFLSAWWKEHTHVSFIGSWGGIPFVDHALHFATYVEILESLGAQFIKEFHL